MSLDEDERATVERYAENHPDAGVVEVLAQTMVSPAAEDEVAAIVEGDDIHAEDGDSAPAEESESDEGAAETRERAGTRLVNRKEVDDFDVYIGRGDGGDAHLKNTEVGEPGWLGNPYTVDEYDREEAIEKYRWAFLERIEANDEFREAVLDLQGKTLACWCVPEACHGDVVLEFLEKHGDSADADEAAGEQSSDTTSEYPATSLTQTTIKDHYERIEPVAEALADVDGSLTIGNTDFVGWYVKRDSEDAEAVEAGYPQEGRCSTLAKDYETLVGRIDRVLYGLTSYKDPLALADWVPCRLEEDAAGDVRTDWRGEKPTPDSDAIRALMAWGDIDLADELKPQRHDLDADTQEVAEKAIAAYADEYADLYGSREPIFALDSVGGSYVVGAPAVTLPIAEHFEDDPEALAWVMQELINRSNDWLEEAQQRVEQRVDGAAEVMDPDWCNNRNRPYKAPLSIHGDHDAVVTPLDIDDPAYEFTPVDDVGEDLITETVEWAEELTDTRHRAHVDSFVASLWPEATENHEDWRAALEAWVEARREEEKKRRKQREKARERRRERKRAEGGLEGAPVTPSIQDVWDAIDDLDIEQVAEDTIVHEWTDEASGKDSHASDGKRDFVPIWGRGASGTANYIDLKQGTWVDTGSSGKGDYGTAVEMALIAEENWPRGQIAEGEDWARGVAHLRDLGYDIPAWTPDANSVDKEGNEYEKMPYWAVRRAAVALSVLPEDAFMWAEGEDGGYRRFPGAKTYNEALRAIEDAGLEHGREPVTSGGGYQPTREELGLDEEPETEEEEIEHFLLEMELES